MINRKTMAVFLIAIIMRGALFFHILGYPSVIFQPDSKMYTLLAEGITQKYSFSYPNQSDRPDAERVPGYPIFLAVILGAFGDYLPAVLFQVILDSLTCALIYYFAEKCWKGTGLVAGLVAALNIGMITYSHFILNDSLFLFAFLILLLAILRFLGEPSWKWSLLTGAGIGITAYIRPVVVYLPFFFVLFFFTYLLLTQKNSFVPALGKSILILLAFFICLSPWMARNYRLYERFKLTAQGGEHLLQYIVPFTWQYSKGIPFIDGMKRANLQFAEKMNAVQINVDELNPFEKSDLQVEMALDILRNEPASALMKAWLFGFIKNLFSPAIIDLSYLLGIDRPHFFYIEGTTTLERAWNFIRSIKGWFGWAVIANILGLVIFRVIQVWGFVVLFRKKKWEAGMCLLIIGYFLLVSGPVGYAKYRLPFEPILIVLLAIGLKDLWERLGGQRSEIRDQRAATEQGA